MALILVFLSANLFLSGVDSKIASNLKFATQALEVADAGLQHALTVITPGMDFDDELACGRPPCYLKDADGSDILDKSFVSGFSYSVTVENDPPDTVSSGSATNDTNNIVVLTSTAEGPNGTKRVVRAYVKGIAGGGSLLPAQLLLPRK